MDCLPMVNSVAINNSGIRRDCARFLNEVYAGLLVVLTEGSDLCSMNRESLSKTCEIGVQGVSFAG